MDAILETKKSIENYLNTLKFPSEEEDFRNLIYQLKIIEQKLNDALVITLVQMGRNINKLNALQLLSLSKGEQITEFTEVHDLQWIVYLTNLIENKMAEIEMEALSLKRYDELMKYKEQLDLVTVFTEEINTIAIKTLNSSSVFRKIPDASRFIIDVEAEFKTLAMIALKDNQIPIELFKSSINEIEISLTNIFTKVLICDQNHIKFFLPQKEGGIKFFPLKVIKDPSTGQETLEESREKGKTYDLPLIIFDILLHPLVKAYDKIQSAQTEITLAEKDMFAKKIRKISLLYSLANKAMSMIYPN